MGDHDCGYKQLFSHPVMVADLLRGFVGEPWVNDLDFTTLERQNGSYVSDHLSEREDDIIWRARWQGQDRWMYVYFLIEFQTDHDPSMPVRIMTYLGLLYQDLIKTGGCKMGARLPPVLPLVIYRGENRWRTPLNIKALIESPPPGLSRYLPSLRYLLLEETRMDEAELENMGNLVAEIFRIELSDTLKASIPPLVSFLKWTQKAGAAQDSLRRAAIVWYNRAQRSAKLIDEDNGAMDMAIEEIEPMLSERVEQWSRQLREEGKAEGRAEGKAEGRVEGKAEGREEGRVEGKAEGRAEGEAIGLKKVARKLLSSGMSVSKIIEVTGLSELDIHALNDQISQ